MCLTTLCRTNVFALCSFRSALHLSEQSGGPAAGWGPGNQTGGLLSQRHVQRGAAVPQNPLSDPGRTHIEAATVG